MTLLIISPDYASHLYPLASIGQVWRDHGHRVVVATGPATAHIVESFGYEQVPLSLGKGSNPGTIRAEQQPRGEDDVLRGFFDATRAGMIETLAFQARARLHDLMWRPVDTARRVLDIVAEVQPDEIVVDHLAFSARLALRAGGMDHIDMVLGHPTALPLPAAGELYGYPSTWPAAFDPSAEQLDDLRALCARVSVSFTDEWNRALAELDPTAPPATDAFAEHGDHLVYNYPEQLVPESRRAMLPPHTCIGSSLRPEQADDAVQRWLDASETPFVYVSFGSFLSVRADVLRTVADALRELGVRAAIAHGSSDRAALGEVPADWLVQEFLPQVTLLERAAVAVTHGGNNSVTEALSFGAPLVVLPFSTDQFAGAEALERAGLAVALAPNEATAAEVRDAVAAMLERRPARRTLDEALAESRRSAEAAYAARQRVRA
ncbi:glycosyltransferase [Leucobacter chromiiresistens]|uniref:Glycosyltransferase n=1 Tax=Leucobacter chromiiresistens TaxID=1079994 RepID=A0A147EMC6_9MICO|nr:glycosyltransferase [Leucobacter chromiiresistens]KTR85530.1 glycosyltransferase [Leucobacter chromiiresistens]